jgi:hypothetical protein
MGRRWNDDKGQSPILWRITAAYKSFLVSRNYKQMNKRVKLYFVYSTVSVFILVTIPITLYIWNFHDSVMASDPQAWGVLGDYIGGMLNPIISFASLCLLGYLTYIVAQQTNKESKNIFVLERRMLAYDELAKHVKLVNSFTARMNSVMSMVPVYEKLPPEQGTLHMVKVFEELREISNTYREFYYTLFEFNPRYGHLFKYDFNSQEYRELLEESRRVSKLMENLVRDHAKLSEEERSELTIPKKFAEMVFIVFVKIRSEVDIEDQPN